MLSRVADSLYWMSRYFERADHCARVLEANYNLLLNPSKPSREQRLNRIALSLGLQPDGMTADSETAMLQLIAQPGNRFSIISCIKSARENASQVREQISSEMWERLNQLYHGITAARSSSEADGDPLRLLMWFREGAYQFYGVTDMTMSHGEGWYFIQLGKYMERACGLSVLLDAHFSSLGGADDLDWAGLLASCSAFEAYRKVYTADLTADRVAEFLLLNPEFPYTVRYSTEGMHSALNAIAEITSTRKAARIERMVGRLRSSLAYVQIEEVMDRNFHAYLQSVLEQCHELHAAVHEIYTNYPIESAFEV
ncbi:MAG: alpha-E domain-containing protein [Acidobacteriaceae bacterium]|nr:alpha-E domain-containing protein [Acidobacteriaceae bacterium]